MPLTSIQKCFINEYRYKYQQIYTVCNVYCDKNTCRLAITLVNVESEQIYTYIIFHMMHMHRLNICCTGPLNLVWRWFTMSLFVRLNCFKPDCPVCMSSGQSVFSLRPVHMQQSLLLTWSHDTTLACMCEKICSHHKWFQWGCWLIWWFGSCKHTCSNVPL